jgi:hypothetical protein
MLLAGVVPQSFYQQPVVYVVKESFDVNIEHHGYCQQFRFACSTASWALLFGR